MVDPANPASNNLYSSLDPSLINPERQGAQQSHQFTQSCYDLKGSAQLRVVDIPVDEGKDSDAGSQTGSLKSGTKSPRPSTLPGLNEPGKKSNVPGLAHLAKKVVLESPQAPGEVKEFAQSLVEGLLQESITKTVSESELNKIEDTGAGTDVSLSLGQEEVSEAAAGADPDASSQQRSPPEEVSCSSVMEADSLDESASPKKQPKQK